jgi:hypothetical protein
LDIVANVLRKAEIDDEEEGSSLSSDFEIPEVTSEDILNEDSDEWDTILDSDKFERKRSILDERKRQQAKAQVQAAKEPFI